jgi:ER membrane protein complex subunit 1
VATEENVVAALSAKNGDILWRQVLETNPRGGIRLLHVYNDQRAASSLAQKQLSVITVSGHNPALVRGWNADTGILEWEWSLLPNAPEKAESSIWFSNNENLVHVIPYWESHVEVTEYNADTGTPARATTARITAPWIRKQNCVLAAPFLACTFENQLLAVNLIGKDLPIVTKVFEEGVTLGKLEAVSGKDGIVKINNQLISLHDKDRGIALKNGATAYVERQALGKDAVLQATVSDGQKITVSASSLATGQSIDDFSFVAHYPDSLAPRPQIVGTKCKNRNDGQGLACRILLASEDGAIILIQQSKIKWIREEALTRIASVDFLDLTLSDSEGRIEEELNNKDGEKVDLILRLFNINILVAFNFTFPKRKPRSTVSFVRKVLFG